MTGPDLFGPIATHDLGGVVAALAAGADPNATAPIYPGRRPLHAAIEELEDGGPVDMIIALVRHGADVDAFDAERDAAPLLMAFFRRQWAAARLLLAAGASADTVGAEGDTPLLSAVEEGDPDLVRLVLLAGAGSTLERARGLDGITPLGRAVRGLDVECVRLLLAAGADPGTPDADRRVARELMPQRTPANAPRWDDVAALLER
jgi:ankyrin repeat protein